MTCKNCGAQLPENQTQCPNCGTENAEYISPETLTPAPKGFSNKKNIIVIIVAAIILIVGAITAIAIGNSNGGTNSLTAQIELAEKYLSEQNYEQAIIEFQKAIEIEPMNVDAYIGLADAYLGLGDTEKAIEILKQGLDKTGDSRLQDRLDELIKPVETESPQPSVTTVETENSEVQVTEEEEPAFGSMGTVTVAGTEVDIATTKSLLVYCNENYEEELNEYLTVGFYISDQEKEQYDVAIYAPDGLVSNDLNNIGKLKNLRNLRIFLNENFDITFLSHLTNLEKLDLKGNSFSDISTISNLANLNTLDLAYNKISDISPLSNLANLTELILNYNKISDISPLLNLVNLKILWLQDNKIADISVFSNPSNLTNLRHLYLDGNLLSDISALSNRTNLTRLGLGDLYR